MTTSQVFEVEHCNSITEVLKQTNQDWNVNESPIYDMNGNVISSHKAIIRDDNQQSLGVVGSNYHPMQLQESFEVLDSLVQNQNLSFDKLAVFQGGRKIILKTKLDNISLDGDIVTPRMNIVQSFDGSYSYHIFFSMLRMVCLNELIGLSKNSVISIRHTKTMPEKIGFAETALQNAFEYFDSMKNLSLDMMKNKISQSYTDMFLDKLIGDSFKEDGSEKARTINIKNEIINLFKHGKGNTGKTEWDLLNGVTEYVDHFRGKQDKRVSASMLGSGFNIKQQAFKLLVA